VSDEIEKEVRDQAAKQALAHGERYPYDAPDSWWHSSSDAGRPPATDWAHAAARGILADLNDRRGIKIGFNGIDEGVRVDIVTALADIIRLAASSQTGDTENDHH
jgi:hypothetical protein